MTKLINWNESRYTIKIPAVNSSFGETKPSKTKIVRNALRNQPIDGCVKIVGNNFQSFIYYYCEFLSLLTKWNCVLVFDIMCSTRRHHHHRSRHHVFRRKVFLLQENFFRSFKSRLLNSLAFEFIETTTALVSAKHQFSHDYFDYDLSQTKDWRKKRT